VKTDCYLR